MVLSQYSFNYNTNGNRTDYLLEHWQESRWVNCRQETTTYDENGHLTHWLQEIWDVEWVNNNQTTFAFDENEHVIAQSFEYWPESNWALRNEFIHFQDEQNNEFMFYGGSISLFYSTTLTFIGY